MAARLLRLSRRFAVFSRGLLRCLLFFRTLVFPLVLSPIFLLLFFLFLFFLLFLLFLFYIHFFLLFFLCFLLHANPLSLALRAFALRFLFTFLGRRGSSCTLAHRV
jgi:hypothetical protein